MIERMRIPRYVVMDKKRGETPLMAMRAWQEANPVLAPLPVSYAGRLDPMAEGKLLVLIGDECKRQEKYRGLDKEYRIEVLLDISTDTGDVLGMPTHEGKETSPTESAIRQALKNQVGTKQVAYPAYSSKTVTGKPLFQYALEGTLSSIDIPVHEETIYRITLDTVREVSRDDLAEDIGSFLTLVPRSDEPSKVFGADFRQDAVRDAWTALLLRTPVRNYTILTLTVTCGSGAYMRTLADRIARDLGTSGLAFSIRRTKIGTYWHIGGIGFWKRLG